MIIVKEVFELWAKAYLTQLLAVSSVLNQNKDKDEDEMRMRKRMKRTRTGLNIFLLLEAGKASTSD